MAIRIYRQLVGADGAVGLAWLGEDLLLLSLSPTTGWIETAGRIEAGLMGSELVRLALAGRIAIAAERVIVQDHSPCGDEALDLALDSLARARREVRPRSWVGHPRSGICDAYLARLEAAGVVRSERGTRLGIFPVIRWRVADPARVAQARARLDAIAWSGGPAEAAQAAFAGLAHAVGLGGLLYRGRDNRQARERLKAIAEGQWTAAAVSAAPAGTPADPLAGGAPAATDRAETHPAHHAAVEAATAAAIHASITAAIHASAAAAHHAAAHDGGGGGHGHH
jgi:hypothetical protein